jgi:hypothetical protein
MKMKIKKKSSMIQNSSLYIKAAKSFFNVPREKFSPRPLVGEIGQFRGC